MNNDQWGVKNPNWKGGVKYSQEGYLEILNRDHPKASAGYVKEHILRAEKALGKPLPDGAVVHHVNGSRDSGPLVICQDDNYHRLLHRRMRALAACGHANWLRCPYCKKYDDPNKMYIYPNRLIAYHKDCVNQYHRNEYHQNKIGGVSHGLQSRRGRPRKA